MEVSLFAERSIAAQNTREEKKQFYRDIHDAEWYDAWDPRFWTVAGILAGKELEPWDFRRWYALGWLRPTERSPFYELTCRGEEARDSGKDAIEEDDAEDDWYDD